MSNTNNIDQIPNASAVVSLNNSTNLSVSKKFYDLKPKNDNINTSATNFASFKSLRSSLNSFLGRRLKLLLSIVSPNPHNNLSFQNSNNTASAPQSFIKEIQPDLFLKQSLPSDNLIECLNKVEVIISDFKNSKKTGIDLDFYQEKLNALKYEKKIDGSSCEGSANNEASNEISQLNAAVENAEQLMHSICDSNRKAQLPDDAMMKIVDLARSLAAEEPENFSNQYDLLKTTPAGRKATILQSNNWADVLSAIKSEKDSHIKETLLQNPNFNTTPSHDSVERYFFFANFLRSLEQLVGLPEAIQEKIEEHKQVLSPENPNQYFKAVISGLSLSEVLTVLKIDGRNKDLNKQFKEIARTTTWGENSILLVASVSTEHLHRNSREFGNEELQKMIRETNDLEDEAFFYQLLILAKNSIVNVDSETKITANQKLRKLIPDMDISHIGILIDLSSSMEVEPKTRIQATKKLKEIINSPDFTIDYLEFIEDIISKESMDDSARKLAVNIKKNFNLIEI